MPEAGGKDHGGGDALAGRGGHDLRHLLRRRSDHRDVGDRIDCVDARDGRYALDLAMTRIDERKRAGKTPGAQIAKHYAAE